MKFEAFLHLSSKIKHLPLPGEESQFKMSPPFRIELLKRQKEAMKNPKKAGVLALFYPDENTQTKLILMLRKTYNGVHSAQVGFPGGKLEEQDRSLQEAAVRETFEEIGVPVKDINVIRPITDVYIPPSNFLVQPFIGISEVMPNFIKQEDEVEELIEVLLSDVLDDKYIISKSVTTSYNVKVEVPAFKLNNHVVWGATAMMLSEIKDLLKQAL